MPRLENTLAVFKAHRVWSWRSLYAKHPALYQSQASRAAIRSIFCSHYLILIPLLEVKTCCCWHTPLLPTWFESTCINRSLHPLQTITTETSRRRELPVFCCGWGWYFCILVATYPLICYRHFGGLRTVHRLLNVERGSPEPLWCFLDVYNIDCFYEDINNTLSCFQRLGKHSTPQSEKSDPRKTTFSGVKFLL